MKLFTKILTAILCVLIAVGGALGIAYSTSDTFRQSFNSAFNIEEEIQQEDTADKITDELKTFSASLDEFEAKIATFENKVTACEDSAISNSATLADVKVELQTLNTDFAALKQDYEINKTENKQALAELRATLNDITARLDVLTLNISNDNLLINGDFRVNQRGKETYTGQGYSVDRWKLTNANTTLEVASEGIILSASATGSNGYINQYIENGFEILKGKVVTFSICIDGNVYSATGTVHIEIPSSTRPIAVIADTSKTAAVGLYLQSSGNMIVQVGVLVGQSVNISWVKLEIGALATSFTPTIYSEELLKCQRYYLPITGTMSTGLCGLAYTAGTQVSINLTLPTAMYDTPKLTVTQLPTVRYDGNSVDVTSVSVSTLSNNSLVLTYNGTFGSNVVVSSYGLVGYLEAEIA